MGGRKNAEVLCRRTETMASRQRVASMRGRIEEASQVPPGLIVAADGYFERRSTDLAGSLGRPHVVRRGKAAWSGGEVRAASPDESGMSSSPEEHWVRDTESKSQPAGDGQMKVSILASLVAREREEGGGAHASANANAISV